MDFRLILESDEVRRILEEASARTRDALQLVARQNIVPPHTDLAALSAMPWEKLPFDLRKVMAPSLRWEDLREVPDDLLHQMLGDSFQDAIDREVYKCLRMTATEEADETFSGDFAPSFTDEEEPSLTLDALEQAMAELKAIGPFPTELWFVDCQEHYQAFVKSLPVTPVTHATLGAGQTHFTVPSLASMPVIEWYMRYFEPDNETIARKDEGPDERQRLRDEYGYEQVWPWFCAIPGIWVRMNDGSAKRLGPTDLQWERFKYWATRQSDDK